MYVERAPTLTEAMQSLVENGGLSPDLLVRVMNQNAGRGPRGDYMHWDLLRHMTPPEGLSLQQWWLGIKLTRFPLLRQLPLQDDQGHPFNYCIPDEAQALLHYIDQHASGEVSMPEDILESDESKRTYLVNSLIEEAIRSSQLEGATTSRVVAKEMIRTGRPPRDRSERMILNNYRALEYMHDHVQGSLRSSTIFELHRILTDGTLDNPDAAGRLQRPDEDRVAVFDLQGSIIHRPPPAEQLPERLESLCQFANGQEPGGGFLHPVVRAILIHFWIGYDHPFEDGNGRTARALFYWSMRTQGYWLTDYLSISRILRQAPAQYMRSYLYSETDERDTTYFILHQLRVIRRAIEELHRYLKRKMKEVRQLEQVIRRFEDLNHRQAALLRNAIRHPDDRYTFSTHAKIHNVTHETARNDLLDLTRRGLLERGKQGRKFQFAPAKDLGGKLGSSGPPP